MKAKLYDLVNWAEVEAIVYSEEDCPGRILGPHKVKNSVLYQTFFPDAKKVSIVIEGKEKKISMDLADEEGFFVATASSSLEAGYYYEVVTKEGKKEKRQDPYGVVYQPQVERLEEYQRGILYNVWEYFGCKKTVLGKKEGYSFLVRVPGAMRVSLVGNFAGWDGRRYPMNRIEGTDVFSLFFPEFDSKESYLYEVKRKDGSTYLLQDPYSVLREEENRIVCGPYEESSFIWENQKKSKRAATFKEQPFLYSWNGEEFRHNRFFAEIKEMGFTHISLPTFRLVKTFYQLPEYVDSVHEFKEFVSLAHKEGLGVVFKWEVSHYSNLQEKENSNFYISHILFFLQEFHLDGLCLSGLEELFYLDYKKSEGEWLPNVYGGNENLEGIELVKHIVSIVRKKQPELLLMAGLDALWWGITEELEKGGLGFDYCYDCAFTRQVVAYLKAKREERADIHHYLSQRMDYASEQNFIMAFEKEELGNLWEEMEGSAEEKFRLLKTMVSYIKFLPGTSVQGFALPKVYEKEMINLQEKCGEIKKRILSLEEEERNNFIFMNKEQRREGTVSFMKMAKEEENSLLILANFSGEKKEEFFVGVPLEGKYQLIFDTEARAFGGKQLIMSQQASTLEEPWDGFDYKVSFSLEPYSLKVFSYFSFTEEEIMEMARKRAEEIKLALEEEAREKIARLKEKKINHKK